MKLTVYNEAGSIFQEYGAIDAYDLIYFQRNVQGAVSVYRVYGGEQGLLEIALPSAKFKRSLPIIRPYWMIHWHGLSFGLRGLRGTWDIKIGWGKRPAEGGICLLDWDLVPWAVRLTILGCTVFIGYLGYAFHEGKP